MEKVILIHGSGHKASSWQKTISFLDHQEDILCPELSAILNGREASFPNLRAAFAQYCAQAGVPVHLCGLSLGGILALDYALDHPENVKTLVLIGTPHKVPKFAFALQNVVFRLLPKSTFTSMAFDKKDTFALGNSMKNLDFSGRLGEVQCPTLILCGEKDGANLKSARFLAGHIPGAELQVLENTGHVVNEENPRALAERLNAFYGRHR
ncbi:MAG TPA: alpha/beta hydrolase [Candidatus Intestinimonas merdavium]|uniref:Alpha/beta hydrolase n=1 Tax=Candidatus Intestinimonas merdavium TaxID=2838622 RepID=A0A9D2CCD1_9FIRM|nr:alpha/beta hydrolase [Candidatus Intestinimonas merdavium]